jgi:hypothetical protein
LFEQLSGRKCAGVEKAMFALLMLSDYTFTQDMHSGRMDLLALLFVLIGLLWADTWSPKTIRNFFLSGFFIAAGLLTTPRVYFLVLPYFGYLIYLYFKTGRKQIAAGIVVATITAVLLYMSWIWGKFGGVHEYIAYLNTPTTIFNTAAGDFFLMNTSIPGYQAIYYVILLVLGIWVGIKKYKVLLLPETGISLCTIALFLLVAGGSLIYMCFITGFIYILAANFSQVLTGKKNWTLTLLLVLNFGMLGYKYIVLLSDYRERSPQELGKWMERTIKPGAKVVADDKYYYAVIDARSKFQYYERGGTVKERALYHKNAWKADYLLVEDTTTELFRTYRGDTRLAFLEEYKPGSDGHFPENNTPSYHGFLFRFVY